MLHVLVVEDEEIMREILVDKLAHIGIKTYKEAASVDEAKALIEKDHKFDLIISDYKMPGGHGGELLRYLYENNFKTPFILFTSSIQVDLPETDENFLGIVDKPNLNKLASLIEQLTQLKRT